MTKRLVPLILTGFLILAFVGTALAANPNPRVVPNIGPKYGELSARWWQWALSFPADEIPYFNTGGAVDISTGQTGRLWFLAGANNGLPDGPRTGVIPAGTSLFFPLVNLNNDYPCPDPTFQPAPGQTLEQFLHEGASYYLDLWAGNPADLFAEIDGVPVSDLTTYISFSPLFQFTADPALAWWDPCITGTLQYGVSAGYWLLLPPLTPGTHTLHFGAPLAGQDITYNLTVTPGK